MSNINFPALTLQALSFSRRYTRDKEQQQADNDEGKSLEEFVELLFKHLEERRDEEERRDKDDNQYKTEGEDGGKMGNEAASEARKTPLTTSSLTISTLTMSTLELAASSFIESSLP